MSSSTFGFYTEPVNGICELSIIRESKNKLRISTLTPLSDDQVRDLYWIILLMKKTGMNLKEILEKSGVRYDV